MEKWNKIDVIRRNNQNNKHHMLARVYGTDNSICINNAEKPLLCSPNYTSLKWLWQFTVADYALLHVLGYFKGRTQGCARFPEFVQNFTERQILWSLCLVDFHTFHTFELRVFFEFTWKLSKFQQKEHTQHWDLAYMYLVHDTSTLKCSISVFVKAQLRYRGPDIQIMYKL